MIVDTLEIARNKYPGSGISLDALCKRFRIDNSRRKKHTALIDCELLSKVYINLIEQKEPIFQFNSDENKDEIISKKVFNYSKKIIEITEDEKKAHSDFLRKEIKKNYF